MDKRQRIIRRLRIIMPIVGLVTAIAIPPWDIFLPWMAPLPDTVQQEVEGALDHGLDGIVVHVDRAGEAPAFYAAGWKDKAAEVPADPQALFKIGSITKLYVAAAVAKLAHAGTLPLDSTLADHLPELVGRIENADRITVRMLVQHRSGIPNFTDTPDYWAHPKESDQEKLELVLDRPADFEPGMDHAYCNTNYLLLSMLMDRTLGYPRSRYIQVEILEPLGLQHTYFSLGEVDLADVMSGYHIGHPHDLKSDEQGMLATAADVGTFVRALNDGSAFEGGERAIYSSI